MVVILWAKYHSNTTSCHMPMKTARNKTVFANSSNLIFFLNGILLFFGFLISEDVNSDSSIDCNSSKLIFDFSLFLLLLLLSSLSSLGALYKEILFIIRSPVYQFSLLGF